MELLQNLVGEGEKLTVLQMSVRAFAMFVIMLVLIRIAGLRTFAKQSTFDNIIVIMLGAVLARGVVGASPYWSTVGASVVLVVMHRIVAWMAVKSQKFEKLVKGKSIKLFQDGSIKNDNLDKTGMSKNDLFESLRLETNKSDFSQIETASMEPNGRISFILQEKDKES
jgi:uncharacterized membrane protein YcaP (DUF421 family)